MEALLIIVIGAVNILCFMVGAKVGQTVARGEKVEMPTLNPMTVIREHMDKKEAEKEQDRIETIMDNINNYDGTDRGQKDVPRG